jgi:hypothetical protein
MGGTGGKELNLQFLYPFPKTTEIVSRPRKIARYFGKSNKIFGGILEYLE